MRSFLTLSALFLAVASAVPTGTESKASGVESKVSDTGSKVAGTEAKAASGVTKDAALASCSTSSGAPHFVVYHDNYQSANNGFPTVAQLQVSRLPFGD